MIQAPPRGHVMVSATGLESEAALGVLDRVNALVPEVVLHRSGVDTLVGECEPAGVTEHVRMDREFESGQPTRPLDEFIDRRARQRPATLRGK